MHVIEVEGLSKDYRQHFWLPIRRVLHSVSFHVNEGEIFGFLGPNGSGKSTTIKILFEIVFPTAGKAKLFGKDVGDKDVKKRIGFLPENPYFYEYLTAHQFLRFHGRLLLMEDRALDKRIPEVLEQVGMSGTEHLQLRSFSKGMLQRVGLAQAIIHDPDLIVLDEPMTGLDPVGRKEVRDLMLDLKQRGKTVFFSTHILSDVESICDRVAILNKGHLLSCGELETLLSVEARYVDLVWSGLNSGLQNYLREIDKDLNYSEESVYMKVHRAESEAREIFDARVNGIVQKGLSLGGQIRVVSPKTESLEDIFMRQVGTWESRV